MAGMKPAKRSLPEIEQAVTQLSREHEASYQRWRTLSSSCFTADGRGTKVENSAKRQDLLDSDHHSTLT